MVAALLALVFAAPAAAASAEAWDDAVLAPLARYALDLAEGEGQPQAGLIDADAAANVLLKVSVEENVAGFSYHVHNLPGGSARVDYRAARVEEVLQRSRLDALLAGIPSRTRLSPFAADFLARTAAVVRLAAEARGLGPEAVAAGWHFFGFRRGGVEDLPGIGTRARAQTLKMLRAFTPERATDPARAAAAEALWRGAQEAAHDTQFQLTGAQVRAAALAAYPALDTWGAGRPEEATPSASSWGVVLALAEDRLSPASRGRPGALWVALGADAARTLADALDLLAARGFPQPASAPAAAAERSRDALFSDATSSDNFLLPTRDAIEIVTIGAAVLDFDRDGRPDLFVGGGRRRGGRLLHNEGGFKFRDTGLLRGVGERAAAADYDGDGWTDLLVLGDPESETSLFRNEGGKSFREVTAERGPAVPRALVEDAAWFDADGDGDLDLYLAVLGRNTDRVTPATDGANGSPNHFYRNDGGRFVEATAGSGLEDTHWSWAVEAFDYDGDGREDIALCNLWGPSRLFRSLGDGRFTDVTDAAGIRQDSLCRGVSVADADGDGRQDLFFAAGTAPAGLFRAFGAAVSTTLVTQDAFTQGYSPRAEGWQEDALYLNGEGGALRRAATSTLEGRSGMSWNPLFADLDLDGAADLYQVNGFYPDTLFFHDEEKLLRLGDGRGGFREAGGGAETFLGCSRGSLTADLDGDLCPDLVVTGLHGTRLLRGLCPARRGALDISLEGPAPNTAEVGAKVIVRAGGRSQALRWGGPSGGQVSSFWGRQLVGLGDAPSAEVTVTWPGGGTETFGPFVAGARAVLRRGAGRKVGDGRR